jgi:hypothetical protein
MFVHVFSLSLSLSLSIYLCRDYYFFKIWGDFVHPYVCITKLFYLWIFTQKKEEFSFLLYQLEESES